MNMGHNDMDYEHGTNRQLSSTFAEPVQNELIVRALRWLGEGRGDRLRDVRAKHADEPDKN